MDKGIYLASTSIKVDKLRQQNQAHEMANLATVGFKKNFQMTQATYRVDGENSLSSRFYKVADTLGRVDLSAGPRIVTDNPLDIFIEGQGVLGVLNENGEIAFTRRGDLRVSQDGNLVNGSGFIIAAEGGGDIQIDPALIHRISQEGVIYASNPADEVAQEVEVARLLLRNAEDTDLEKTEDGLFKVMGTENPGDFVGAAGPVTITPFGLEGSSVKSYDVLTRMIEIERSYELKVNVIKELGDMSETSQSLMQVS